ncbi:uncharacterized protein LOC118436411 [Folsomia candida]|uniref:uncharacterized protein LOC118436411 n=1 Tax=Folsomia candida TaxID=158441 RepID=UPI00160526C6|nr:uncharacterized protein LOC118436411 [Folsomia candida]
MGRWKTTCLCILYLEIVTFFYTTTAAQNGSQCGGYCTDDVEKCKNRGGRIMGFCTNALACCDPLIHSAAKCGDVKRGQRIVDFKSPEFPASSSGDLTCLVKIDILKDNVATRVDFIQANMEGPAFAEGDNESGQCEADMIFLRGFETWAPPPRCGNLSGYSFLIDRDIPQAKGMTSLSILALMASPSYRWHIRVVQLVKTKSSSSKDKQNSVYHSTPPAHDDTPVFNKGKRSLSNEDLESKLSDEAGGPNWRMILNGEETHISRVPWQVSFRYKTESLSGEEVKETENKGCSPGEGSHFCGGSIIADQFILTASHCFYGTSKTSDMLHLPFVKAVVGDTNLCSDDSPTSSDHDVESVTMHYAYDGSLLINDIAVVKLKTRIKFKDHVTPVLLAATGDDFSEREALLSGWGDYLRPVSTKKNDTMEDDEEASEENETDFPTSTTEVTISTTTTPTTPTAFPTSTEVTTSTTPTTTSTATTPPSPPPTFVTTTSTSTAATTVETTTDFDYENITVSPPSSTTPPPPPPTTPLMESSSYTVSPLLLDPVTQFELDTPTILQSSKRFVIQNRTVCNARDLLQYSAASAASVEHYLKYQGVFESTLCTLGAPTTKNDERPVSTGKGDSGGALIVYVDQVPHVVGVVSYGVSENAEQEICNPGVNNGTFDYFSSVPFFRGWIDLVVLSHQNYSHVA